MKHLNRFEHHMKNMNAQFENNNHNLTGEDLKMYNYILGIDEANESLASNIMDRLKKVARNGVLTATILTSLLNTPAFANEYKTLSPSEKTEILKMVSPEKEVTTKDVSKTNMTINIGSSFKSGEYEISNAKDSKLMTELAKLNDFINTSGEHNFKITITSSESQVPNKDAKTGEHLEVGQLSKLRAQSAESLVKNYIESLGSNAGIAIDTKSQVGTHKWDGGNAHDAKYTSEQFVNIKIEVNQCPLCGFEREYQGNVAGAESDYIGYQKSFQTTEMVGKGSVSVTTGTIPDRVVLLGDGQVIGDSGYVADATHQYKEYKYVPSYVAGLTKVLIETPNAEAIKGAKVVHVETFADVMTLLLKPQFNNPSAYNPSKDLQNEVKNGIAQLKSQFDGGQRDFVIYDQGKINISYDLQKKYDEVKVVIFSPIGKTGFDMKVSCK